MNNHRIAYFSMEIALDPAIPTYSGGLGILAGDTIRSAADMSVPMVAITLLHRMGYLSQKFDQSGWQREEPSPWSVEQFARELPQRASLNIEGRQVQLRAWQFDVTGCTGFVVPVFLLDSDLPENSPWDRTLTHFLYGGDAYYRICQEMILGIGGLRMLRALGLPNVRRYHLNEGHAGFLGLELLDERARAAHQPTFSVQDIAAVRDQCIFTTHTPVSAGHDQFPMDLAQRVLGREDLLQNKDVFCCEGSLNMTFLALNLSHYINGVAKKHAETTQIMFAKYQIDAITNGVHASTWISPSFQALFDQHFSGWRQDNFSLRFAHSLPPDQIWAAHSAAKESLLRVCGERTGVALRPDVFTIGFARRATSYKRADLLLSDLDRIKQLAAHQGKLQLIFGGKAHPNDHAGKEMIQRIIRLKDQLQPDITLIYLENYDFASAKLLTSGVDLWLNTPLAPFEASGTSGMKAALNGVPSLSILDGWWIEGWIEGQTGWAIGEQCGRQLSPADQTACETNSLYEKLETKILPLFYQDRQHYIEVMRHCISLNGSFFNTQRMLQQYVLKAYLD